jgi:hypothetical protein
MTDRTNGRNQPIRPDSRPRRAFPRPLRDRILRSVPVLFVLAAMIGCGAINLGKWKGLERSSRDEEYYLVKDMFLTAGSAYAPKELFDHNVNESVNLFFTPRNEPNVYTAESVWYDPTGLEFRTIRTTYDKQKETGKGEERQSTGTTRIHSMPTKELFQHKPGVWKVELHLDGKLARRMAFSVR